MRSGAVGGSPEIHEKINPASGSGAVVVFTAAARGYRYVTSVPVAWESYKTGGVLVAFDAAQRAVLTFTFEAGEGAKIAFFGTEYQSPQ